MLRQLVAQFPLEGVVVSTGGADSCAASVGVVQSFDLLAGFLEVARDLLEHAQRHKSGRVGALRMLPSARQG